MFDYNRIQYILETSSEKTVNLFYRENIGICVTLLNKKGNWHPPQVIIKNCQPDFSACLDKKDNINIVYQDKHGNIFHLVHKETGWKKTTLINSKNPSPYRKYFYIWNMDGKIHMSYVLKYSGKNLLSYQSMDSDNNVSNPKVLDYIVYGDIPYIFSENGKTALLGYKRPVENKTQLGIKSLEDGREWGTFEPISNRSDNSELTSLLLDKKQNIHICLQKVINKRARLIYKNKKINDKKWGNEAVLIENVPSYAKSSMLFVNDIIICYWVSGEDITLCRSFEGSNVWSDIENYEFYGDNAVYCASFLSTDTRKTFCSPFNIIPVKFVGGYKMAFIEDIKEACRERNENESFKIMDYLDNVSKNMEDMKKMLTQVISEVNKINAKQNKQAVELEKINLKGELLHSKASSRNSASHSTLAEPALKEPVNKGENNQKKENEVKTQTKKTPEESETDKAIIPGTGFSYITPEFLKKMQEKE